MMKPLQKAVESAIAKIVTNFQKYETRFWCERDLHWSLFYYLKQETIEEEYPTQCVRAEFPTIKLYKGKRAPNRGHFDLVVLDWNALNSDEVRDMPSNTPFDIFLPKVPPLIAVEIKLWLGRLKDYHSMAQWDISKLTDQQNRVNAAYFLNFFQLNFDKQHNRDYYWQLREYFTVEKSKHRNLNILCVPQDKSLLTQQVDMWVA